MTDREREALRDDVFFDLLEFAENNFNAHERTPEGTIMATLTRKGRKSVDMVPKYEMITYYRGNSIPSSHIHMYDPENVTVACNIFKVNIYKLVWSKRYQKYFLKPKVSFTKYIYKIVIYLQFFFYKFRIFANILAVN